MIGSVAADIVRLAVRAGDLELAHRLLEANPGLPGRPEHIVATGRALLAEAEGRLDEAVAGFTRRRRAVGSVMGASSNAVRHCSASAAA